MQPSSNDVFRYHDGTKHDFHRFARSLGYLDWASQPSPFRSFAGARVVTLYPAPAAPAPSCVLSDVAYDALYSNTIAPAPVCAASIGDLMRHAMGLSAWKQAGPSRWPLRVNPSSGNLHPTESYVACGALDGLSDVAGLYHYASDRHALEERCRFDAAAWRSVAGDDCVLVALTSIHWREAWKYGERAFRYCQHDIGHAIGALAMAAAALGWDARLLRSWSQDDVAAVTGIDRDADFLDAEREEPACVLAIGPRNAVAGGVDPAPLLDAVRDGVWCGRASQLSEDHVQWTFIDEISAATRSTARGDTEYRPELPDRPASSMESMRSHRARTLFLQRRSAVDFDARTSLSRPAFLAMLDRVLPRDCAPWRTMWWEPCIDLLLFVHRVDDVPPGLYVLGRSRAGADRLLAAMGREFSPEPIDDVLPLVRLASGDCRALARRLSCDQDIAADGCFSLGMLANFEASLDREGPSFYRQLFWEAGLVGHVLYLEAEAAGVRGTGIGCFYDDRVHEVLGLSDHRFQSLYHFTIGGPVEDRRIAAEPGYPWE